jgi:hypothetical protein
MRARKRRAVAKRARVRRGMARKARKRRVLAKRARKRSSQENEEGVARRVRERR